MRYVLNNIEKNIKKWNGILVTFFIDFVLKSVCTILIDSRQRLNYWSLKLRTFSAHSSTKSSPERFRNINYGVPKGSFLELIPANYIFRYVYSYFV